ncbi:peptidoglycan DD-metalloendopeptidase family protein [Salipaludibacillus sp. HK11]|uniref:peptidoglycan DD-metalloendopeptidase family protein n=1 Tax=Salipaludibacillus sp. HK11 TaxID=3394320 RepID=UPI0039FCB7B2
MTKKTKQNKWTVMVSSGPKDSVKQFQLRKLMVFCISFGSLGFIVVLLGLIGGLVYTIDHLQGQQTTLTDELNERKEEIGLLYDENQEISQDATAVQETVKEFKEFEEKLSQIQLELPVDLTEASDDDGSGGVEIVEDSSIDLQTSNTGINSELKMIQEELPGLVANFEETVSAIAEYEEKLRLIPTFFPAEKGRISSEYGNRSDPFTSQTSFHSGTDIAAPIETEIYAAADGEVTLAGRNGGYGNTVVIKHGETYETLYAHLNSIDVSVGDIVEKGEYIGGMGTTGRSTGVHLHFEVQRNGELVDPYKYMTFHKKEDEN